jgi:probable HAF family extracellular repeat protein
VFPGSPQTAASPAEIIDLGTLGGCCSWAEFINDKGQVSGEISVLGNGINHAFLWTASAGMIDIGTIGGTTHGHERQRAGCRLGHDSHGSHACVFLDGGRRND